MQGRAAGGPDGGGLAGGRRREDLRVARMRGGCRAVGLGVERQAADAERELGGGGLGSEVVTGTARMEMRRGGGHLGVCGAAPGRRGSGARRSTPCRR